MIRFDGLTFDGEAARLTARDGQDIELTAMEVRLLALFVRTRGRVLNHDQILEMAHDRNWDPFDGPSTSASRG